jgi:hypothetical protein
MALWLSTDNLLSQAEQERPIPGMTFVQRRMCAVVDDLQRLSKQLRDLDIPFVDDFNSALQHTDHIVDAVFGMQSLFLTLF